MTTFSYTAMEPSGRKRTGFIDATDKRAAIAAVTAEGRFVLEIKEESRRSVRSAESKEEERKGRTTKADVALFTRRLSDLTGAGLPLLPGFDHRRFTAHRCAQAGQSQSVI